MKDIQIRIYNDSDYATCRSLWAELTQHHRLIYDDPTIGAPDPGEGFDTYLALPKRKGSWVIQIEDRIIGFTGLLAGTWEGEGEIEPVIITSEYRHQGIGTKLVQNNLVEAKKMGIRFLSVRPVARNKSAISFFVKLGFNTIGYVDLFQDLDVSKDRKWETGITVHGIELKF